MCGVTLRVCTPDECSLQLCSRYRQWADDDERHLVSGRVVRLQLLEGLVGERDAVHARRAADDGRRLLLASLSVNTSTFVKQTVTCIWKVTYNSPVILCF